MRPSGIEPSVQAWVRAAGLAYLVIIACGLFGEMGVREALVDWNDAAATAHHLRAEAGLWRLGVATDLLMHLCDVLVFVVLYLVLRIVNRPLALVALTANIVQTAVLAASKLFLLAPLFLLADKGYLAALAAGQAEALALVALRLHGHGFAIGLIFFGVTCLAEGHLIRRSGFLPRLLGVGMQVAGACYIVNSFALILSPPLAARLFPLILLPPFLAELAFAAWLLVKGVDVAKWRAAASA
ncbi:MAG TPA: DUF4386 domain-containing protein [Xanthomonadaceae bacterium]|nr:DUF4386 domain-containing protein [Xanthomonadaceae bacterium]